jgi:tetratricopeptide (TPR) repeat protein
MNDWSEAESRVERGRRLAESGRLEEALREFKAALEIDPYNAEWLVHMGQTLDSLDRFEDAVECYRRADSIDRNDFHIHYLMAVDLTRLARHTEAVQWFERLSTIDPTFEPAYCHRIHNFTELGDHENAELMFYMARQLEDQCAQCWYNIAKSLQARGRTKEAIECWEKALKVEPSLDDVHRRLGLAYWKADRLDLARQHFAAELRSNPNRPDVLVEFGTLMLRMDDPHGAARMFERAIELDPEDMTAYACLADTCRELGFTEDALSVCRTALKADADHPDVLGAAAHVYFEQGYLEEARAHLNRALSFSPDNPELRRFSLLLYRWERLPRIVQILLRWKNALFRRRHRKPG